MRQLRQIYRGQKTVTIGIIFFIFALITLSKVPSTYAFIYGTVFVDSNQNGVQDSQDRSYNNATITATDGNFTSTVKSDNAGSYDFTNLICPGTYTTTLTVPSGYIATTPDTVNDIPINCGSGYLLNFGIAPNLGNSISGNIFIDSNKNGILDSGESNYQSNFALSLSPNAGTITTNPNGTYTITNLPAGTYTISYQSLPSGYVMTSPRNGPPPSFQVTVGTQKCNSNNAPGAVCTGGNITGLNFGISNIFPWYQATCGDLRMDNGINDPMPSGQTMLVTNTSCDSPGVAFTGDVDANLGNGQVSSTDQLVGGALYPEVYSQNSDALLTSYSYLLAKSENANMTSTPLYTVCRVTSCTLPPSLSHGIYVSRGDITLNSFTFPANQDYIFLIKGNVTITGPINVPVGSTVLIATSGNIIVEPTVGTAANLTTATLAGWYVAGQSFILPTQGNCTDLRLNIAGSVVVNAEDTNGTLQNNRDLCASDADYPTLTFQPRLDFILNAPQFLEQQQTTSLENTP